MIGNANIKSAKSIVIQVHQDHNREKYDYIISTLHPLLEEVTAL